MASSHQLKNFDVFLSFRGEDTRRGFVSHLHKALTQQGIQTFIDDNLTRGENIFEELLKVIEKSSALIIVFSKNYASSSWCLDDLAKIIDCTKKVLPVFYQVDPSEVHKQRGDFGKVLTKLEKKIKDKTKVQRWRDALNKAANIFGWDDKNSYTKSELVQKIVEEILNSEFIQMPSNVATMELVGINSHIEALTRLLNIESNDVRMVGITGLGGIGKTTIAKAIYDSFSNHFKAKSFVQNVREWSKTEQGKIHLQETLLKDISEDKNLSVSTIYEGTTRIKKILHLKKVLIILDDVDNTDQIETLLGQCEGFAFQSRIILTTRNKRLLANQNGLSTYDYEVKGLDEDVAIELFRKHAFPSNEVPEDYLELEQQAISYAKGLPLALKVMGRDLCEKTIHEWDDALDCYKTNPLEDIQNILKRSYEGLTENEKNIFLDIACFFNGYDMSYNMIKDVLKACGLNPVYGIRNLIDKCLLTIDQDNYNLSMHDLLQQMGMDIVRQEAPQKPGERSRIWCYEEALDVLTEDMGSDKIRSIILWPAKSELVDVQIKAQFCKMKNLRLLLIRNVRCCNGPLECLPNGLRLLDWREYPFSSWPPNFFPKKLVVLNMPLILLKKPILKQNFASVTYVDFSWCNLITKISDLSNAPNIMQLIHSGCKNLVEIDDSVGRLDKLKVWDLGGCKKLDTLPNCLTMKSLTYFNLAGCERIKKFPNILHEMKGVEFLNLWGNCTNELPPSFGNLIGLKGLTISSHSGVAHLPVTIYNLQHIKYLELIGDFLFPKNVEIDRQPMCNSLGCSSRYVFPMLKQLRLIGFEIRSEIEFILNYCCPLTLEELEIHKSKVVAFPERMSRCERLHTLIISDCDEFLEIQRLPHSVRHVEVAYCLSLDLQSFFQLLPEIIGLPPNLPPCLGVTSHMLMFPHSSTMLPIWQNCLCEYSFEVTGYENDIPNWFNHQRDGNLISFSIGPEFPTIALCIAFEMQDSYCDFDYCVFVSINGSEQTFERKVIAIDGSFGHLSFSCRPQSSLQELFRELQLTNRNQVEILCETFPCPSYHPSSRENIAPIVERIGVHVECNCLPPQNPSIFQDINRHLSLQSGLGLPMDTENGSDLGLAFYSSNVDGFDLGSSSVAQHDPDFAADKDEKSEKQIALEPHGKVFDVGAVKMTDSSKRKEIVIEEIGSAASQTRQPEGIQVEKMQPQALSSLKPQGVVFDVGAVKILKSSDQMESHIEDVEMETEAGEKCGLFLMQGGLGLILPPKDEDWKNAKEIYLMDNELSILPENPRCPNLSALFLPRNYKLRMIPPSFFDYMPALQILNLSRTSIKSLPDSVNKLVSLKRLFLNDCHRLMVLSPKVGDLKQLEVLDLEGAKIMDLPMEIEELTNLKCLEVSFYGYMSNGRRAMQSNAVVPCRVISALSQLEELNIDVNPDDERWDACVENIVTEVCTLTRLETLKFYFPRVELLRHFQCNRPLLSHFRFTVGRHVKRIMSRVPPDVEFELERWERCLKYINGVGVPGDIKNVLHHVTAFFLDRHATVKKLSDFGTRNMKKLKCCVVGECNEVQVIIDAADAFGEDGISEIVSESYDVERIVLGSLEYLYIYFMKSLRCIWEGSVQQNSLFLLKSLTLRTCPLLTTIFTQGLLDNLCNLEELKVEDCPSIKSIVSCGNSSELGTSYFLPNLKKILLHYMPGLVTISSGLHIAPQLEFLSLYNCPNLKNPLVDEVSCQDLKKIKGERSWWEALEWSNGRPCYLDEIFVPTDI